MFGGNDITFCSHHTCKYKKCRRNQCNVIGKPKFLSIADFKNTNECPLFIPPPQEYTKLRPHIGHNIVCVCYGKDGEDPQNISIECETCNEVLYSIDRTTSE